MDPIRSEIRGEQLKMLFQSDLPTALNIFNGFVVAAVLWPVVPPQILVGWISAMAAVSMARIALRHAYLRRDRASTNDLLWIRLHAIGCGLTGLLWGSTAWTTFSVQGPAYHLFVGLTAAGMSAGALSALFAYVPSFLAYVVPYVGPMAAAFLIHGDAAYKGIGVLMVVYIGLLAVVARHFNTTFLESVRLRAMLARANAELEVRVAERTAALRDRESRLRAIFDNTPEGVFLVAPDGTVLEINASGLAMADADSVEQGVGKNLYAYIDPEDRPAVSAMIERVFRGEPAKIELAVRTLKDRRRWWEAISVPLFGPDGRVSALLGIARDTTESRSLEAQLRQAQKLEAIGQLTGGIAHNFNNLLSVTMGNLEMILDRADSDPTVKKFAQKAHDGSLRGAQLVEHLLAFSRKQMLQPKVVGLADELPEIGGLLRGALDEHIDIKINCAPDLWPIVADPSQLDNAILNLALNARDAMPKGGTLTIDATNARLGEDFAARNQGAVPGDCVLLAVTDTGTGMAPEVLERAFEPFFTTKEAGTGTGLGLSMVYGFVKQSNGYIKIDSAVGRGTVVKMYLPRASMPAAAETAPDTRKSNLSGGGELILVVEDNEDVRTIVVTQLTDLGYRILEAETGAAALDLLGRHPDIDLVYSDVVLRGISGHELAREIRRRRPDVKILLTSGHDTRSRAGRLDNNEEFELLKKPYRKRDLAQKLREVLLAGKKTGASRNSADEENC